MRNRLNMLLIGRNGIDQLAIVAIIVAIVFYFLESLLNLYVLSFIPVLLLAYALFRIISRNVQKRREENARFVRFWGKWKSSFAARRERRAQSKDYKFFTCPACKATLRVPRGKGKLKVTCAKCGQRFDGRT
ncbi:MAG: zinc-ribbon domain-containing protein [Firmicutes bacterium]|nr:zinc-ribbon domain-containing protein [Bacillota bacterium]